VLSLELQQIANVRIVQQQYEAFARRDWTSLASLLDDNVDWLFFGPSTIPFTGHFHGPQQVLGFFQNALRTAEFLEFEPQEFLPAGEHDVLVQGWERVRALNTGRIWETEWAHVFRVRGGKIARLREYYDTAVMVAAFEDRPTN
jgi:ketosteroid isomerase-like protein